MPTDDPSVGAAAAGLAGGIVLSAAGGTGVGSPVGATVALAGVEHATTSTVARAPTTAAIHRECCRSDSRKRRMPSHTPPVAFWFFALAHEVAATCRFFNCELARRCWAHSS